jgi:hypothetical protein
MSNLYVEEAYINKTEGYRFGDSDVQLSRFETPGDVFRFAQKEYGRCISKVYLDVLDEPKAIGWVFLSKARYEDTDEPYLREVWITLHDALPTLTREAYYHEV